MAKFSNDQLANWQKPVSGREDDSIQNVVTMVRNAINNCEELNNLDIDVFLQGSYENNTNVKLNSDVDINVCLKSTFYYNLPAGRTKEQYNIYPPTTSYSDFKDAVEKALINKFGKGNVKRKNKCIHIKENTYHHDADVVPTFEYRNYGYYSVSYIGVKFMSDDNKTIINYPKQQVENGTSKNDETHRRYKRTVRILKRIRYKMEEEKVALNQNISSFLIESLLWNVSNVLFEEDELNLRIKLILEYLYSQSNGPMKNWNEESNLLPLFSDDRKWNIEDVREFIVQVYKYMGYCN